MNWENKIKMVQLGNQRYESTEFNLEFQKYVLENIDTFDFQAWDMFCNLTDLTEIKSDSDYWKLVYNKIKDIDCNNDNFNFRTGLRIAMIQTFCEDIFI